MITFINSAFEVFNTWCGKLIFADILFFLEDVEIPLVIFVLAGAGLLFTFKMRFVNLRMFGRAIRLVKEAISSGDLSNKSGEISHFKALTTALSATVGLGNIAGVAIAISVGGPGATLWMIVMGILGMSTKFTECTLAVMYREKRSDGHLMGGPMEYLQKGLAEIGYRRLGRVLSILFCLLCVGGSFGGGTAFQVNQSLHAIADTWPTFSGYAWLYGLIMTSLVGVVILKGLKRLATVASRIVPFMCMVYVALALIILVSHWDHIPMALWAILQGAVQPASAFGGLIGVIVTGIQRAAFSNEAGLGSAAIAHSAAKVNHPVEEGIVALLEPFIDTVCICTMTALVIVITGAYENPAYLDLVEQHKGAALTFKAMSETISWAPYILSIAVTLFAFSTIISWSYYGERCFSFVFGERYSLVYKVLLLLVIFLGSVATSVNAMEFSDLMILSMAFPNLVGAVLLSGKVKSALKDYQNLLKK